MEGERLILKDLTTIENGSAGLASGYLWLRLPGLTMAEAAAIALNPAKTEIIWYQYGEMENEYRGYTNCTEITADEGQILVCLTRGN